MVWTTHLEQSKQNGVRHVRSARDATQAGRARFARGAPLFWAFLDLFPCLVFNDRFKLDKINIDNLIFSNKPSPEGWADVIKMALEKIGFSD